MPKRTIILKGRERCKYDEAKAGQAGLYPGMLVKTNSSGNFVVHDVRGGRATRQFLVEDSLQGTTYTDAYANGQNGVRSYVCPAGTELQALLHFGENVSVGDFLISYGDGTLCKAASAYLANNAADSTAVTNTVAETTFSNGSVTIPKNTLKVGDIVRVRGHVVFPSTNATDTASIKVKIGSTAIITVPATDVANNDVAVFEATLIVRTIGAAGTVVANGWYNIGAAGTGTSRVGILDSTVLDTTADATLTVTCTWSVANAGNQAILRTLVVEQVKAGTTAGSLSGGDIVAKVKVAKDLSAAVANDFVECEILD